MCFSAVLKEVIAKLHKRLHEHIKNGSPLSSDKKAINIAKEDLVKKLQYQVKNEKITVPEFITQVGIHYGKQLDYLDSKFIMFEKYFKLNIKLCCCNVFAKYPLILIYFHN